MLNSRLNMNSNNKIDVINLNSINLKTFDFTKYSVVCIDSNMSDELEIIANNPINEDVVFIVCSIDNTNVNEDKYTYIDFEELSVLPMFKKISKVNEIRNKLKTNKSLKKFKFF